MIEFEVLKTKKYYLNLIFLYIFSAITFFFYALLLTRGTRPSTIDTLGVPFYQQVIAYFLGLMSLIALLHFIYVKDEKYGEIILTEEKLIYNPGEKDYYFRPEKPIRILLNPSNKKPVHYREMTSFGGNNWIELEDSKGNFLKYEFLLKSDKQEQELIGLTDKWREIGFAVETDKSKKLFWENFM